MEDKKEKKDTEAKVLEEVTVETAGIETNTALEEIYTEMVPETAKTGKVIQEMVESHSEMSEMEEVQVLMKDTIVKIEEETKARRITLDLEANLETGLVAKIDAATLNTLTSVKGSFDWSWMQACSWR